MQADLDRIAAQAGRIAILLPSLEGGGAERSMLNLAAGFVARGRQVDLVLCKRKGAYMNEVPQGVRVVELQGSGTFGARLFPALAQPGLSVAMLRPVILAKKSPSEISRFKALRDYLLSGQIDVLVSALPYANLLALWAREAAGVNLPVIVTERIALLTYCRSPDNFRKWRWRYLPELVRRSYPAADRVVTVSDAVARELLDELALTPGSVETIYNPVVNQGLLDKSREPLDHPWFTAGAPPVILGVGRLTEQKDFATLIRAFARVREKREARLVLLGEGRLREELEELARHLGIHEDVGMPGFVDNPFRYMARSAALALSSEYEGLPGVLIQAMACGCPVVSTNCPGGSEEVLDSGRFGQLVNVGDADALASALASTLSTPLDRDVLIRRAEEFSVEQAVDNYLALIDSLYEQSAGPA
ncbi:MAG: glycosyltransferase [Gammaproteobacteria bacterium]|jgi:glycosyltransferase involved in cell wall biosynthesis|nr:glycosyltransferase [Gammaproteobacteria bacterium]